MWRASGGLEGPQRFPDLTLFIKLGGLLLLFIYGLPMCQSEQEWRKAPEEHSDNITLLRMVRNIGNLAKMTLIFFSRWNR